MALTGFENAANPLQFDHTCLLRDCQTDKIDAPPAAKIFSATPAHNAKDIKTKVLLANFLAITPDLLLQIVHALNYFCTILAAVASHLLLVKSNQKHYAELESILQWL